jgi:hypothetical protein
MKIIKSGIGDNGNNIIYVNANEILFLEVQDENDELYTMVVIIGGGISFKVKQTPDEIIELIKKA